MMCQPFWNVSLQGNDRSRELTKHRNWPRHCEQVARTRSKRRAVLALALLFLANALEGRILCSRFTKPKETLKNKQGSKLIRYGK
jgi:hypothetical protein